MEQLVVELDAVTQRYLRQRCVRRGDLAAAAAAALRELALRDGVAALERWHEAHPHYADLADQETAERVIRSRFGEQLGTATPEEMEQVDIALKACRDLD